MRKKSRGRTITLSPCSLPPLLYLPGEESEKKSEQESRSNSLVCATRRRRRENYWCYLPSPSLAGCLEHIYTYTYIYIHPAGREEPGSGSRGTYYTPLLPAGSQRHVGSAKGRKDRCACMCVCASLMREEFMKVFFFFFSTGWLVLPPRRLFFLLRYPPFMRIH